MRSSGSASVATGPHTAGEALASCSASLEVENLGLGFKAQASGQSDSRQQGLGLRVQGSFGFKMQS